jgi:hypothetical protein
MKIFNILLPSDPGRNEETPIKSVAVKFFKVLLMIFMISWITLFSSCFVRGPGYDRHDGGREHHEGHEHHDNDEHHH